MSKWKQPSKCNRATWAEDRARAEELWGAWLAAPPGPEREAACRAWLAAHGRVEALDSPGRLVEWIEAALPGLEQAERVERAVAAAYGGGPPDLARLAEERDFAFRGAAQMGVDPPWPSGDPLLDLARLRERCLGGAMATDVAPADLTAEARALALLVQHPDWTDERIAKGAGCSRRNLYRFKRFTMARAALKVGKAELPRGPSKDDPEGDDPNDRFRGEA